MTPAMALRITDLVWSIIELIEAALKAVPMKHIPTPAQRRRQTLSEATLSKRHYLFWGARPPPNSAASKARRTIESLRQKPGGGKYRLVSNWLKTADGDVVVLLLVGLDAVAAQRGDGLHPILRERLLGLAGDGAPREPMGASDEPNDSAPERGSPSAQRRRLVVIDRGS